MLTRARLDHDVISAYLDYIRATRAPRPKSLVAKEAIQLGLFDEQDLFETTHPDFPGERLIWCPNPELGRKQEELLQARKRELAKIVAVITRERRPLRGKEAIGIRVGKVIDYYKMAKHYDLAIGEAHLAFFTYTQDDLWYLCALYQRSSRWSHHQRGRLFQ